LLLSVEGLPLRVLSPPPIFTRKEGNFLTGPLMPALPEDLPSILIRVFVLISLSPSLGQSPQFDSGTRHPVFASAFHPYGLNPSPLSLNQLSRTLSPGSIEEAVSLPVRQLRQYSTQPLIVRKISSISAVEQPFLLFLPHPAATFIEVPLRREHPFSSGPFSQLKASLFSPPFL